MTKYGVPLISGYPFYIRFMQCIRRYYDTKKKSHLVNAAKYGLQLLVIVASYIDALLPRK
jgi:hypothetical protein